MQRLSRELFFSIRFHRGVNKFLIIICGHRKHLASSIRANRNKLKSAIVQAAKESYFIERGSRIAKLDWNSIEIVEPSGGLDLLAGYAATYEEDEE
jgi:hypothetical protein